MTEKWFNVGKIVNTHGVRGEIRVISRTDFPEERYAIGNKLYIFTESKKDPEEVTVAAHRLHKNFHLLTFEGYTSIGQVEQFKGAILKVPEDQQGELDEGEFYFHEIIACTVYTAEGEEIGKIREILTPGANDVWVIQRTGKKDALIPYIDDIVEEIDIANKRISIRNMEGLLD
ncbi:ribosome maturation factor RimM [Bacillus lacus]|uniref:Ribosome maturation factor RimM n=1 Tax=Metabacillus lacus TaxID=1983721 RepID=A0A7X2IVK2_9BACI|nr:ribosome maturation factor RimM [Metabacillus lacus]MRX70571.1 ribosome maturation factor RimM [Metabacillus lacus]